MVGEFGLPQSVQPEVLLAVDQRETFGEVLCEEFVDDRESAVELRVGLLYVGVEGVVVDRRAVGEGREAVADVDATADQPQFFEMFEGPRMARCSAHSSEVWPSWALRHSRSRAMHSPEAVGRQLFVAVVGIFGREAVDVVALGLIAASGKVAKIVGVVDVILQRAVRLEREMAGNDPADRVAAFVRQADDPQPLSVGVGVFAQEGRIGPKSPSPTGCM